ncbi:hypothetical protein U746_1711 [Mycolicibacterium mucogenicum 261Sha1.1M5]|nr:hypothetical protein U746_1711 [Mycolicibacterium mucogenicum 261Sha1.1M5]
MLIHRGDRGHHAGRTGRLRLLIAAGALIGVGAAVTAAAYLDQATVRFSASGGVYDIAFADEGGGTQQGNPTPYEINVANADPINEIGSEPLHRTDLVLRNAGTTDSGSVTLTLKSLLPRPAPDDDGVRRDPFDVMLVTAWGPDGELVADAITAKDLVMTFEAWPAGEDRAIAFQFAYQANLGTPYYFGKDTKIGVVVDGVSS